MFVYVTVAPPTLVPEDRIKWALDSIERETSQNNGVYPFAKRKPGIQEVLRRSGFSPSYLERKGEDESRDAGQAKLKSYIFGELSKINNTPRVLPESQLNKDMGDQTYQLRQAILEAELELYEVRLQLEQLKSNKNSA
ncbi:hypothetical protein [Rhizobium sp. Leaf453]|uniref:hypothetical protein n=1 Tax=Rhizobium sp. Leaf453 TaxID=1736380 RepID=UPI000713132B|nr:hypothetical protein [Rhizobium sp. Leaf453]KQT95486.1 hypothetical protein ASG68_12230 [Rhizobium sp. Leaf453]